MDAKKTADRLRSVAQRLLPGIWLSIVLAPGQLLATAEAESQRIYRSAYFLGRGDTGVATADGAEAIHYNPAGIAQGKGIYKETVLISPHVEMSSATKDLIRKVGVEGNQDPQTLVDEMGTNQHIGIYNLTALVFRRAALGATVSSQANLLPSLSPKSEALPRVSANAVANQAVTFTLAEQMFTDGFTIGANFKYIRRTEAAVEADFAEVEEVSDRLENENIVNTGFGTGADLGLMWEIGSKRAPLSLGLMIENVGKTSFTGVEDKDKVKPLAQQVHLGFAISPGAKLSRFRLLVDVRDITGGAEENPYKRIHIGTEISILGMVGVTGGLNQGYPTAGLYLDLWLMRIDLGTYTQEMGTVAGERPDSRFYFRLTAGF